MRSNPFDAQPEQYFEFELALELGMTVADLRRRMPNSEFAEWLAFCELRQARQAAERKKAEAEQRRMARGRRG